MRSISVPRLGCVFRPLRSRGWLALGAALFLTTAAGCPVPPTPDPPPQTPTTTPPPIVQRPQTPSQAPDLYRQKVIVIHQADLFGQFEGKQGQAITIRALLMMTKTQPAIGNKGVLYVSPTNDAAQGEAAWVALGDVEVKQPLDAESRIQVKMVDDEKKFVMPGGKKPGPLPRHVRMRLRWQW